MRTLPLFARSVRASVSSGGEGSLIRSIRHWLGSSSPKSPAGIGDDCAVVKPARGRGLLTVDSVIHGVHFDAKVTPRQVGAKLLKRNLSDIAAMGGKPRAAVVALAMDERISRAWLAEFYRGLARESRRHGVPIVGGDVARLSGAFVATLTLTGESRGRILTRSGSRLGDWIYVTGVLGRSLQSGHHYRFQPRLAEGAWLARRLEVHAMMDLSDGLARDLPVLTPPKAAPALFADALPKRPGASLRDALADGEDYELVFSVAAQADRLSLEQAWHRAFPRTRLSSIGRFVRPSQLPPKALNLSVFHGYDHLR